MGKERDIFISYSSKNLEVAEDIREYLEQNGFSWWMAPYCIAGETIMPKRLWMASVSAKCFYWF